MLSSRFDKKSKNIWIVRSIDSFRMVVMVVGNDDGEIFSVLPNVCGSDGGQTVGYGCASS